jgi:hypothetical protein
MPELKGKTLGHYWSAINSKQVAGVSLESGASRRAEDLWKFKLLKV